MVKLLLQLTAFILLFLAVWSEWSSWSSCIQTRSRTCIGIGTCSGNSQQTISCNTKGCSEYLRSSLVTHKLFFKCRIDTSIIIDKLILFFFFFKTALVALNQQNIPGLYSSRCYDHLNTVFKAKRSCSI